MLEEIVRVVVRLSAGMVLGVVPGALYAGLVGAAHLSVYGRWDRVPAFAVGCVMVGAVLGLLGGIAWALPGEAARERAGGRPVPPGPRLPGSGAHRRGAWLQPRPSRRSNAERRFR